MTVQGTNNGTTVHAVDAGRIQDCQYRGKKHGLPGCIHSQPKPKPPVKERFNAQLKAYRELLKSDAIANSKDPKVAGLRAEVERRLAEITQHLSNPKGPSGQLSSRQSQRVNYLMKHVADAIKTIRKQLKESGTSNTESTGSPPVSNTGGSNGTGGSTGTGGANGSSGNSPSDSTAIDKAKSLMRNGEFGSAIDTLDAARDNLMKQMGNGNDAKVEQEINTINRMIQRIQNMMDQQSTMEANREKNRHEARMAILNASR